MAELIRETIIRYPIGAEFELNMYCPICGQLIAWDEGLDLCEHCLAAYLDTMLTITGPNGVQIFEEKSRPELFENGVIEPEKMFSTGTNFILGIENGFLGPLRYVFEADLSQLKER